MAIEVLGERRAVPANPGVATVRGTSSRSEADHALVARARNPAHEPIADADAASRLE